MWYSFDKFMEELTVKAPAKINLHLKVKNRRPDGFHELESIFLALDLGDTLHLKEKPLKGGQKGALEIDMDAPEGWNLAIPMEKNIIFKAVCLFRERTGYGQGLKIRVEKRIPLGAGLGGGSSDAASTLLALNLLAGNASPDGKCPLDGDSLAEMAVLLGSDVPFFVKKCPCAWVSGRGEIIQPIAAPGNFWIVLVNPGFASDTAQAYRLLDEYRDAHQINPCALHSLTPPCAPHSLLPTPNNWHFENDFLQVFEGAGYQEILHQLREQGADFANLSGSGSTCFGIFLDKKKAKSAVTTLSEKLEKGHVLMSGTSGGN